MLLSVIDRLSIKVMQPLKLSPFVQKKLFSFIVGHLKKSFIVFSHELLQSNVLAAQAGKASLLHI